MTTLASRPVQAAILAALALAGTQCPVAAAQDDAPAFTPPDTPLMLTRELRRPLSDGKEVVTRRSYEVRIERQDAGFLVNGRLVDVMIEAPEELDMLADIERSRPDTGLFPIRLGIDGMVEPEAEPQQVKSLSAGVELVSQQLRQMSLPAADAAQAQAFTRQFLSRPGLTQWPADLFRPAAGRRSHARELALPDGGKGHVLVETQAEIQAASGLLSRFDRTVTTSVAEDNRRTIETWRLTQVR